MLTGVHNIFIHFFVFISCDREVFVTRRRKISQHNKTSCRHLISSPSLLPLLALRHCPSGSLFTVEQPRRVGELLTERTGLFLRQTVNELSIL
jgi:hypothetical protein